MSIAREAWEDVCMHSMYAEARGEFKASSNRGEQTSKKTVAVAHGRKASHETGMYKSSQNASE